MGVTFEGPAVFVTDMAASRDFYERLLGQEVLADFGANVAYKGGFSLWLADSAASVIRRGDESGRLAPGRGFEMYFESDDLDGMFARIAADTADAAAGGRVLHPVVEQPWGQRGFRLTDPDGVIVEVGEPLRILVRRLAGQGMSLAEIAARTSIPEPMASALLEG